MLFCERPQTKKLQANGCKLIDNTHIELFPPIDAKLKRHKIVMVFNRFFRFVCKTANVGESWKSNATETLSKNEDYFTNKNNENAKKTFRLFMSLTKDSRQKQISNKKSIPSKHAPSRCFCVKWKLKLLDRANDVKS